MAITASRLQLADRDESAFFLLLPEMMELASLITAIEQAVSDWPRFRLFYHDAQKDAVIQALSMFSQKGVLLRYDAFSTNFFRLTRPGVAPLLKEHPDLQWGQYCPPCTYRRADLGNAEDYHIVENFLLNSAGVVFKPREDGSTQVIADPARQQSIQQTMRARLSDPMIHVYIVTDDTSVVGCFIVVCLEPLNEFYLNWVIGRSTLPNHYRGPHRLPILLSSVLTVFQQPSYQSYQSIAFNSRKEPVVALYRKYGFIADPHRQAMTIQRV